MGKLFLVFIFFMLQLSSVSAGLFISEVFPNTIDDKNLEYVEFINTGEEDIDISGYYFQDKSEKKYTFDEDGIIIAGEKKKYLRLDTKIILNNSKEEIYLYDKNDELIDEISYLSSEKGIPIIIDIEGKEVYEDDDEEESIDEDLDEEDNNNALTSSGSIENVETGVLSDVVITLQRPSYIELTGSGGYICDRSKQECKVNFDLRETFSDMFPEKNYTCHINLGFESSQSDRCNPNTVIIPEGDNIIHIKITSKDDPNVFIEREIEIENDGYDPTVPSIISSKVLRKYITLPSIGIQSGIDELDGKYVCKKKECKINLVHKNRHKDLGCRWSFGKGATYKAGTDRRCNPGYVSYPHGEFRVQLMLYQKNKPDNFRYGYFKFENPEEVGDLTQENSGSVTEIEIAQKEEITDIKPERFISDLEQDEAVIEKNASSFIEPIQIYDYSLLKISQVLPNPKGNDNKEWVSLINTGGSKMNLNGCEIDDIKDGGSKPYKIEEDLFIDGGDQQVFYKIFTGINLNNSGDSVSLNCGGQSIDSLDWDQKISDNILISHEYPDGKYLDTQMIYNLDNEAYDQYVNKTFKQNERLLKSGFKISGETLPNSEVELSFSNKMENIYLKSDSAGLYEVLLKRGLIQGNLSIKTQIIDSAGKIFLFDSDEDVEISGAYIESLKVAIKKKKTKKVATKKPTEYFISVANAGEIDKDDVETSLNSIVLIFLVTLIGFLFSFLAMKRRRIFD